jgi:imidazolonepropionase-like amidohydrolase
MQVSGRAMDVTGAYPVLGYAWELQPHLPHGVQEVDGVEGGRKAVREQLSYGTDWVKVYSDRSYLLRPDGVLDDIPTFTLDELKAIVDETHRQRHKVASHATALQGVHNSVVAGVDSIEHGDYIADEDLRMMKEKGIIYVPTIFVGEYVAEGRGGVWPKMIAISEQTFQRALKSGVKIAFGTDVGGFSWDIDPAVQFKTMVKLGMTPAQALHSATVDGAELLGWQDRIGTLDPGKFADIIAVPSNPLDDITQMEKVNFVMKGGEVWKK